MTEQETFEALKYCVDINEYGTKRYYNCEGKLHREEGPAVIWYNGSRYWFLDGESYSQEGFNKEIRRRQNNA